MHLYHFTTRLHLSAITKSGFLKVTESNVGSGSPLMPPTGQHVGPDVVWLTSSVSGDGCGLDGGLSDKTELRFVVEVPDAVRWVDWAPAAQMHPRWRRALSRGQDVSSWYVVERPIPMSEWVSIEGAPEAVGRNEQCPCGSGLKFKRCHLEHGGFRPVIWPDRLEAEGLA